MTKKELTKEDKKFIDIQEFIGVIPTLGLSVHRIRNEENLTRIEITGIQYNQKKLYTSTYLCLDDNQLDSLIELLQVAKNKK